MPRAYVTDQRGLGKQLKRVVPRRVFRAATRIFNATAGLLPDAVRYSIGESLRRRKVPYCIIEDGDLVVQVGAPRDTLRAGRSRAIYFARMVGTGRVLVVEPDSQNVAALREFVAANHLENRVLIAPVGAWNVAGELKFLSSAAHPASNVVVGIQEMTEAEMKERGYRETVVPVKTIDSLISELDLPTPKLVSITTNGAEVQIVEGMSQCLSRGCSYISLASTGNGYLEFMEQLGFAYTARDDRGYFFRRGAQTSGRDRVSA